MMRLSRILSSLLPRGCTSPAASRAVHTDSTVHHVATTHAQDPLDRVAEAGDWWDPKGIMKPLHSFNDLRVPFIRDVLLNSGSTDFNKRKSDTPLEGLKILDIGCGGGLLSEPLAALGAVVTGIDTSAEMVEVAQKHAETNWEGTVKPLLMYVHTTAEEHAEQCPQYYDAVVSSEVIEHVDHKAIFVEKCAELLKPGGSIIMTTQNQTMLSWVTMILFAECLLKMIPEGTHDWNMFIPPQQLQSMLEKYGCVTKAIYGTIYNPIFNKWSIIDSTQINYILHAVKSEYPRQWPTQYGTRNASEDKQQDPSGF